MLRIRVGWCAIALVSLLAACGGSSDETDASVTSSLGNGTAGAVRAAALAYAHAYLTGSVSDVLALEAPKCLTGVKVTPSSVAAADAQLEQLREQWERRVGMSSEEIEAKISGVSVRNVTAKRAEAEVQYDLPESITGNDNWVTYRLYGGTWKDEDCVSPIGGFSESHTDTTPAP